jgi:iron complex transport system substrate-binding protein
MITRIFAGWMLVLILPFAGGGVLAEAPRRFVSINLCTDQLLLTLADREEIIALSPFATDPILSFMADSAVDFRHDAGTAEQVIMLDPDLVFAGRFTRRATRDLLTRLGYEVVLFDPARSIDQSIDQIAEFAKLVGNTERGDQLIGAIEAAREEATGQAPRQPLPTAAVYRRRGYVTGADTLTNELLEIAGFANIGGDLAGPRGGFVDLENLIWAPPDVLVLSIDASQTAQDQGSALVAHRALAAIFPVDRRIVLPERLTVCGGPSVPAAINWLAEQAQRLRAR